MNKCILAVAFSALFSGLHAIDGTPSSAARFTIPQIGAAFKSRQDGTMEYVIGIKLLDGIGIAANPSAAFAQFVKAADKGHPFAYFTVSQLYAGGVGTSRNPQEAVRYMRQAAQLGVAEAQYNYSGMLMSGLVVKQDFAQAIKFLKAAKDQGHAQALCYFGILAQDGLDDFGNRTEPNYEKAFGFFKQSATKKSYGGIFHLAQLYSLGLGVKKNKAEAEKLFHEILESQDIASFQFKALMYETGSGVPKNLLKAQDYYQKCAAQSPYDVSLLRGLERVNEKILKHAQKARELEEAENRAQSQASTKRKDKGKAKAPVEADVVADDESEICSDTEIDIGGLAVKKALNAALQYDDKSVVADVDTQRETITINNPFDGSVITVKYEQHKDIQKTTKKLQKFNYDARIQQWFGPQPETLSSEEQKTLARHRFAQRMDEIIQIYGAKAYFVKQDGTLEKNKTIQGRITTKDNRVLEGTFEYAYYKDKDNKKILYHRFLHPESRAFAV